jgi:hypothetical protein
MTIQLFAGFVAAGAIGATAWRGCFWLLALAALVPALIFCQTSRRAAAAVVLAYFGAASWPVIATVRSFSPSAGPWFPVSLWVGASALLSLPWIVAWTRRPDRIAWRIAGALLVTAVPPLGLIGWASPLTAAGVLFPGTAWLGLAATAFVPAICVTGQARIALHVALGVIVANVAYVAPSAPPGWVGVDLSIVPARGRLDPMLEYAAAESIQAAAIAAPARVVIFPEGVIRFWTDATRTFWQPTIARLAAEDKTALLGVGLPIPGSTEYRNAPIVIGAETAQPFAQRVPVPLGMWKPFGPKDGVPLRLTGPGTIRIGEHRAALLICYEQLLVWPMLQSAIERPTVLIGIASEYWTTRTPVPAAQWACLRAWSRLFAIPVVTAFNR